MQAFVCLRQLGSALDFPGPLRATATSFFASPHSLTNQICMYERAPSKKEKFVTPRTSQAGTGT